MSFIDERGRVFGRLNLFDAAVLVGIAMSVALAITGYRLLRVPLAPSVSEVVPRTLTEGPGLRITIKGQNLLPYMHVYFQRTGEPTEMMHDSTRWVKMDAYSPANGARAAFRLESPTLAEIETLDLLMPGTYDLIFLDETRIVGKAEGAFSVLPKPKLKVASRWREVMLRVDGAFIGMNRADAGTIKAGAKIPTGAEEPWGEVVSADAPARDVASVETGRGPIDVGVLDKWRVRATLNMRCVATQSKCYSMEMPLFVGDTLTFQVDGSVKNFLIEQVSPAISSPGR